jgi:hypothetical protein
MDKASIEESRQALAQEHIAGELEEGEHSCCCMARRLLYMKANTGERLFLNIHRLRRRPFSLLPHQGRGIFIKTLPENRTRLLILVYAHREG